MATYQQAIDGARLSLNDASKVRYLDDHGLTYGKDCIREIAYARPDMFLITLNVACIAGQVLQTVENLNPVGLYIVDVHGVVGGNAITRADFDTLRRYRPGWRYEDPAPAQNWFPITDDITKRPQPTYMLYPRPPAGQQIVAQYVFDPLNGVTPVFADVMPIPDQMLPGVEAYIIYRCEMADDEHVIAQRAQAAYANFGNVVGLSMKQRKLIALEGRPQ